MLTSKKMSPKKTNLAEKLLLPTALNTEDSARLILELLETTGEIANTDRISLLSHCRHIIQRGAELYSRENQTLPFYRVVEESIRAKSHRRARTLSEIRQYCNRIIRCCPHWRNHPLRKFTSEECSHAVETSFDTPNMQRKALVILHSLFNFGIRRELCNDNPVSRVQAPRPSEKRIPILSIAQIRKLLETALRPEHLPCAPALGIMLWTGIRPTEIERLTWSNIHISDRIIDVEPRHAKTGGARQVTIQPVLVRWLRKVCLYTPASAPVTPKAWSRRWQSLRRDAGFQEWQADTLRHSFASYHLRHFHDLNSLQLEMGHASSELLRTRYLSMGGLSAQAARQFWGKR